MTIPDRFDSPSKERQFNSVAYNRERNQQTIDFYFEFSDVSEKERAKTVIREMLDQAKTRRAEKSMPYGPDGYIQTDDDYFLDCVDEAKFLGDDPNRTEQGIKVSFKKTPQNFSDPESLENYILQLFHSNNIQLAQKDNHDEVYEVIGNEPQ